MAVSGVGSSSSIYGNRNVLTGLASGMDTESLLENAISAYKNKIATLNQKRTKTVWKQDAYRSIISKMSSFTSKYASYQSSNNLMSVSFWNQAVKAVAKGANADKVSATGRSSSNIQVDRVLQLATSATYKYSGSLLDSTTSSFGSDRVSSTASGTMDLNGTMEVSGLSGSLSLAYGGSNALSYLTIDFEDTTVYEGQTDENGDPISAEQALANEINRQLETQSITIGNKTYTGKELTEKVLRAEVQDGKIIFNDLKGNNVYISGATGEAKEFLAGREISSVQDKQIKDLTLNLWSRDLLETREKSTLDYLDGKNASMSITVDGVTKNIRLPGSWDLVDDDGDALSGTMQDEKYIEVLQQRIDEAFGKGKLTVSDANGNERGIQFKFEAAKGSTFAVSSSQGEATGFGESKQVTSYLNTGKTLGELLGSEDFSTLEGIQKAQVKKTDANGNVIYEDAKDANGKQLYSFMVNGKEIGQFNEDSTLSDVMNAMNNNSASGVGVSYSKLTNELTFTAKETGAASEIRFDGLAAKLFGAPGTYDDDGSGTYTKGQNAIFEATVNGTSLGQLERSSNSVDLDGMTVNLKGTFGYETNEDGSIKYNTTRIDFTGDGEYSGEAFYGVPQEDGTVKLFYNSGAALTYKPTSNNSYNGQEIFGRYDENGDLRFYMTDKNGENEREVYLKKDGKEENGLFSITNNKINAKAVNETKTAVKAENTEAVTFETSSDADRIVDIIKQMVEDYNAMATEIKKAYSTLPAQKSSGAYYEPLTEEEEEGATESFINSWNEKAKEGILFGDGDLRSLYTRLTSAISMTGEFGATLRSAGITVNYSDGLSTLSFDENKFRAALDNNPDKVRDAFASSVDSGASSNGLMSALKQPLDMYGKTSGGKGILVEKAGSPLAASTLYTNTLQKELDNIDKQIEKWQDLMSNQVDYYTNQFSRLEQLVMQMNSQSSYFSQLLGGYGGY